MQGEFDLAFLWASFCISDLALKRMGRQEKIKADESLMGAARSARGRSLFPALEQSLRAALPPQEGLLTPFSSLLAPQHSSKGWRQATRS